MNTNLNNSAQCYGLYNEYNDIIGFCAVIHRPHNKILNLKGVHRLVILPDYQGIGLGTKFLNIIADIYAKQGYEFSIVTSAKNMIAALYRSDKWFCTNYTNANDNANLKELNKTNRTDNLCGRFMYKTKRYE